MPTPIEFLREAIRAVPAVKYALGIGGVVAAIAVVFSFKIDPRVAVVGTVVMLVLMGVLVVFARMSSLPGTRLAAPALVFTWFVLVLFMATSGSLFSSVFFQKPLDLSSWLTGTSATSVGSSPPLAPIASVPDAATRQAAIAACVQTRTTALLRSDSFAAEGSVRCEGGGAFGNGQHRSSMAVYQAPPGFHIVGNVTTTDLSNNRGSYGAVSYVRDESQRATRVEVPISCRSPDQIGGPGAWMHVRLNGRIEAVLLPSDRASIERECATTT